MRIDAGNARRWIHRLAWLVATLSLTALVIATFTASRPVSRAANISVDQCNDIGPGEGGATTSMTCVVTVVNTINGGVTGSTVTVTRSCALDPCPPGNGTFTSSSADLVTNVNQCNGSGNDAAHPTTCTVTITNNISADTPGAQPVTAATVDQCVGSGGGGGGTLNCDPFPATTTSATITQCNGSANGGGATANCTVGSQSTVSAALATRVNQCNGTGNPGGSTVTCQATIVTNITAAAGPSTSAAPSASASPSPGISPSASLGPSPSLSSTPSGASSAGRAPPFGVPPPFAQGPPQVFLTPRGWVEAGGGSATWPAYPGLLILGVTLLVAAALSAVYGRRITRNRTR